jgi:hypothetical protein
MKKAVITSLIVVLIMISCQIAKKKAGLNEEKMTETFTTAAHNSNRLIHPDDKNDLEQKSLLKPPLDVHSKMEKTLVALPPPLANPQFDSDELDRRVIEMAHRANKDEKTFRMLLREDPDGTKIYRSLGMHIIVAPKNDEIFLPDEL